MHTQIYLKSFLVMAFTASSLFSFNSKAANNEQYSQINNVEVIVISDIDDTIESSHIKGPKSGILGHAINPHDEFFGMSNLYRALDSNGVHILYVSGMPQTADNIIGGIGGATEFLRANSYPGEYILRGNAMESTYEFKVRTITAYLKNLQQQNPNKIFHIIAPGDNGEQDIRVLDTVAKQFPELKIDTYIHKLYENGALKILPSQRAYYTAADLATQIYNSSINQQKNILNTDQMTEIYKIVLQGLSDKDDETRSLVLPSWAELTEQDRIKIKEIMLQSPAQLEEIKTQLDSKLNKRLMELEVAPQTSLKEKMKTSSQVVSLQCDGIFL